MGIYTVQVTLNIDEDKIAESIERDVYNKVIKNITNKVEKQFFNNQYYYSKDQPITSMVKEQLDGIFEEKKEEIADSAVKILTDKLIRSKMVREKVGAAITKNIGE